jgi:hypothetical protein
MNGDMNCPKCEGNKKIVVFKEFKNYDDIIEKYGLLQNCNYCYGSGKVSDPDW